MIAETSSSTTTEAEALATKDPEETQTVGSAAAGKPLSDTPSGGPAAELEVLYDVNLPVSVELGRTLMTVGEMLSVCQGSVIPLERATGEPVDVLVSGKVIGKGEVVVVDDKFGVRITELVNRLDGMGKP
jgi:flagellar motor switch protein FliN/FliY